MTQIAENIAEVRAEIAHACERTHRFPEDVTLVCVSKYQNKERMLEASFAILPEGDSTAHLQQESFYRFACLRPFPDYCLSVCSIEPEIAPSVVIREF